MKALRIPLRVVFYTEEGEWVAHCLEFDIVGSGATREEALEALAEATNIQVEQSLKHDNPRNLFFPADGKYFEMFAAGKDVGEGEFQVKLIATERVVIERTEAREYSDNDLVPA